MAVVLKDSGESNAYLSSSSSVTRVSSLLASTSRVEAPFIRVRIGDFTFGVYEESQIGTDSRGFYKAVGTKYPNYIQSLNIKKINGTVNQYTLDIKYPVTQNNDPNFFDKVFSTISKTRKITFDYGDFMMPNYIYRNEEAIITSVDTQVDVKNSVISYTVKATSAARLTLSGSYNFGNIDVQPSSEIKRVLYDVNYRLTDVFSGMKDKSLVSQKNLIASDDKIVHIPTFTNISVLEYLSKLVSYMTPNSSSGSSALKSGVYTLTTYEDTTGVFGGPYFKVEKIQSSENTLNKICMYDIDIGYPTANIVTDFSIKNNAN
jgi:hypothetical protein